MNPAHNVLDVGGLYEEPGSIAYAACLPVLTRDAAADVRVSVSTTVMAEVWLNNGLIGPVSGESSEGILDMELKPGENLLFFKVFRDRNRCVLSAKLTDRDGGYLADVGYADAVARLSEAGVRIDRQRWQP